MRFNIGAVKGGFFPNALRVKRTLYLRTYLGLEWNTQIYTNTAKLRT